MRRRQFIVSLGAGAATWPLVARAQRPDRVRRIGVLMGYSETDPEFRSWLATFEQEFARLGWADGGNVRTDIRWAAGNVDRARMFAKELAGLHSDVILAATTPVTAALQRETRNIPIVFAVVSDPVGAGLGASLARPGGNITGFINIEEGMGGKWLQLLTEIMPGVKRAAILFNPDTAPGSGSYFLPSFEAAARSLRVEPIIAHVRTDAEIETVIASLGREKAGLVVMTDSFMAVHREPLVSAAARNNVPATFDGLVYVNGGGLLSYGPNYPDIFRRAAGHVDRILRGEKPSGIPVEAPTKFDLAINLKTAKALGLTIPETLLATADKVIE
jgi:putative tryptophan/tyrosine transport system substrate-binding protein